MPTYIVTTSGRDDLGLAPIQTMVADALPTNDGQFEVFKKGGVVVKTIPAWMVDTVELADPPQDGE
jgi:hypothetical protein